MGKHDNSDLVGNSRRDVFPVDCPHFVSGAEDRDQSFGHVDVGWEVAGLRQDHLALGAQRAGRGEELEQVH